LEVSALKAPALTGLRGPLPLLRLQSDERLVALVRRGHHSAFEALVARYESRLLAFCRHMLGSREDAEDVLQEVFAAAFNALLADEREINVRPWLYRIARNRSLNHLRRQTAIGQDSMDVHLAEHGLSTGEKAMARENVRELLADVQQLPETQRTALLLREIDALSYEQIAEAMETTVPSVKSLLVRARVSLAEMAESRRLTCDEVRIELGEVSEGLVRISPPVRRHLKACDRCTEFRATLKANNRALAAVLPVGPLVVMKKLFVTKLGLGGASGAHVGGAAGATAGGATATAGAGGGVGLLSAGAGAVGVKAVAGFAAAAIVTAGAVEVNASHARHHRTTSAAPEYIAAPHVAAHIAPPPPPAFVSRRWQPVSETESFHRAHLHRHVAAALRAAAPATTTTTSTVPAPPKAPITQTQTETTVLPANTPPTSAPPAAPASTAPATTISTSPAAAPPPPAPPALDTTSTSTGPDPGAPPPTDTTPTTTTPATTGTASSTSATTTPPPAAPPPAGP
jgi:RNA polymerase sigma factor (sigma-70 family)